MTLVLSNLKLNNIIIEARQSDNFVNATQMCKAGSKRYNDWFILESTKELIDTLQETIFNEIKSETINVVSEKNKQNTKIRCWYLTHYFLK